MAGVVADSLKRSREAATLRPMPGVVGWWAFQSGLWEEDEEEEAEEERRDRGLGGRGDEVCERSLGPLREEGRVRERSDLRRNDFLRM